ncbi:MAG: hypothetical protein A2091_00655 [Desulfuromonadales bacterium GWD2_61_12]|nr:MAG: hypothetical protein A2091_00655 [Desulfuromonadales bacterium GWD2_61_12]OGR34018.1 MAG: hypothetical protein A2005_03165 [Desulfuromonadales bacterium GWC2_61_20]HAD05441.1 hypothetical protein [Desulfuromonas sp.]
MIRAARTSAGLLRVLVLALALIGFAPSPGLSAGQHVLIEHYRNALLIDPDNLTLHYYLGVSLLIDGHDKEAVASFTRAYPAMADSVEMNYNFGLSWSRLGDPDSALLYLEQAEHLGAAAQPGIYPLGEVYYNIALNYLQRGETKDALALFARVLQLNPGLTDVYRLRGDYYARSGDSVRALDEFRQYLAIYPDDPLVRQYIFSLLVNQGLQQLETGLTDVAALSFREAVKYSPDSPIPRYYLGFIAFQAGRYDEAASALDGILTTAPAEMRESIRAILFNVALTLQQKGDNERALRALASLATRPDATVRELSLAGNICLSLKRYDAAIDFYHRTLILEPSLRNAAMNLLAAENALLDESFIQAQSHFSAGEFAAALALFEKILVANPAYPLVANYVTECRAEIQRQADDYFALAAQTLAAGNARQALEQIRKGLALAAADKRGLQLQEQALSDMSQDLQTRLLLAQGLMAEGRLGAAQEAYSAILQLDPDNATAQQEMVRISELERATLDTELTKAKHLLDGGDPLAAIQSYRHLLGANPGEQRVQQGLAAATAVAAERARTELRLGRDARASGRKSESRKHFANALRYQDSPELKSELAQLDAEIERQANALLASAREALQRDDLKGARTLLVNLRATAPDTAGLSRLEGEYQSAASRLSRGLLDTANAQLAAKNYSQALTGFRRVLDHDPLNSAALAGLQQGKLQLQQELTRLFLLGNAFVVRGDLVRAEGAFAEALALDPFFAAAKTAMEQLAQQKQPAALPGDDERLYLRGIEFYTRGKYEEAVSLWQQVLILNPNHEKARMNIEKARRKILQIKEYQHG